MTGCSPSNYQQATSGYMPLNCAFEDAPSIPYQSYHQSSASPHLTSSYLFRDPTKYTLLGIEMITPKTARNRRKGASGDQVKHRRTRSGCFTCRGRRVKVCIDPFNSTNIGLTVDSVTKRVQYVRVCLFKINCAESTLTFAGCRKGNRECAYPDPTASKSPSEGKSGNPKNQDDEGSSGEESNEGEDQEPLEAIIDEDESQPESSRRGLAQGIRAGNAPNYTGSDTPSLVTDQGLSPTPSTEGSAYSTTAATVLWEKSRGKTRPSERALPTDIKFFLKYFVDHITYLHYSLKMNTDDVLRGAFLDVAVSPGNEALLNAVVGFSAYHYTLHNPQGRIQHFLQYYNKAVTLLLASLKKSEKPSLGTLLCMLQLAAIEVSSVRLGRVNKPLTCSRNSLETG